MIKIKPLLLFSFLMCFVYYSSVGQNCKEIDWLFNDVNYETLCDSIGEPDSTYIEIKSYRMLKKKYKNVRCIFNPTPKHFKRKLAQKEVRNYLYFSCGISIDVEIESRKNKTVIVKGDDWTYLSRRYDFPLDSVNNKSSFKRHLDDSGINYDNGFLKEIIIVDNYFLKFGEGGQLISWFWLTQESIDNSLEGVCFLI